MPRPSPSAVVRLIAKMLTSVTWVRTLSSANVREDRDERDAEGQEGGDHAAERDQQQDQGDRDGDALGDGQVFADLATDVGALVTADAQGGGRRIDVASSRAGFAPALSLTTRARIKRRCRLRSAASATFAGQYEVTPTEAVVLLQTLR